MSPKALIHTTHSRAKTAHRWIVVSACALFFVIAPPQKATAGQADPSQGRRTTASAKIDAAGITRSLYAVQSRSYPGTPEQAARAFLGEAVGTLRIRSLQSTLITERVLTVPGGSHVIFHQTVQGLPVYHADIVVSLNADNQVGMVLNNTIADLSLQTVIPAFDGDRAIQLAHQTIGSHGKSVGKLPISELMAYRDSAGADRLVYRIAMVTEEPAGDWEILLDAQNGRELRREDRFVRHSDGTTRATGTGYVYLDNPLSAARQAYGVRGFIDADDADSDSLSAYRTLVQLDSLKVDRGLYYLSGPYCSIVDIESPADSLYVAASPDGFRFTRSQPGFEAVMAYYHITAAYRRVLQLGFSIPSLELIQADPHGYQGRDNSHYSPSGNWVAFGTGGVDDAEDADVIWHEYGHAINYGIVPSWGGGECGALGEGYGDYWAASHARSLAEWRSADPQSHWLFGWDGHNPFWPGRITNDAGKYPFGPVSIHAAGQIWASALMGIRDDLGGDVTDRLVVKSFYYLTGDISAVDAAQAVLQADRDLYEGRHLPVLCYWLSSVKSLIPSGDSLLVLVINDDARSTGSSAGSTTTSPVQSDGVLSAPSRNVLAGVRMPEGFSMQMTAFAQLDTAVLQRTAAVVLLGGQNSEPFGDATTRAAVRRFVERGGKALVEGGQVGYSYRRNAELGERDAEFRRTVLGSDLFVSDAPSSSLVIPGDVQKSLVGGGPFFNLPNILPTPIQFSTSTAPEARDAVTPVMAQRGTIALGGWSSEPSGKAIIAQTDSGDYIKTIFLPFALSSIKDSSVAVRLVENALTYLLFHQATTTEYTETGTAQPVAFELLQNYPNPFNPSTTITFSIPEACAVKVEVFSILGQRVRTLLEGALFAATHSVRWDGRGESGLPVSSGMYIVRFEARPSSGNSSGIVVQTRRMSLLR